MKNRNLLSLLMLTICGQVFFSCNTARQYEFSNRTEAYHSEKALVKTEPVQETAKAEALPENLTASAETNVPAAVKPLVDLRQQKPETELKSEVAGAGTAPVALSNASKKELRQALKLYKNQVKAQGSEITGQPTVDIVELIFAILIPPIGVLLHDGGISTRFWISLVLTLLFIIPGIIYALLVVTDTI